MQAWPLACVGSRCASAVPVAQGGGAGDGDSGSMGAPRVAASGSVADGVGSGAVGGAEEGARPGEGAAGGRQDGRGPGGAGGGAVGSGGAGSRMLRGTDGAALAGDARSGERCGKAEGVSLQGQRVKCSARASSPRGLAWCRLLTACLPADLLPQAARDWRRGTGPRGGGPPAAAAAAAARAPARRCRRSIRQPAGAGHGAAAARRAGSAAAERCGARAPFPR
jgi:hypothetical protein